MGWRVVAAAHFGVMVGFGSLFVHTFGIFLKPLAAEFSWSREQVSLAFGIAAIAVAVTSPVLGKLLDRYPPRAVILPCFVLFGAGILALSQLTGKLWELYAICVVLGLAGNGTTQMGYSGAVSSWFTKRRGLALSIVLAGVGLGTGMLPQLANWVMAEHGWRAAYLVLGTLVFVFGIPLTALWVTKRPVELQQSTGVGTALRQREFWLLSATLFLSSLAANGALTHLPAHLSDRGFSASTGAVALAVLGVSSMSGRLATGWLLDRFSGPRLSMLLLVAMAAGILMLSFADTLPLVIWSVVLIGIGVGGEADVTPFLLSKYFGLGSFSTLYGLTWTVYAMAGATGPVVFGRVFDATGSYAMLLTVGAGVTLVAGLLMLLMRPTPP